MLPQLYDSVACVCDLAMSINSYQNGGMGDGRDSSGGGQGVLVLVSAWAGSEGVTVMASTVEDVKEINSLNNISIQLTRRSDKISNSSGRQTVFKIKQNSHFRWAQQATTTVSYRMCGADQFKVQ
jgi:hypothetical protein